MANQQLKSSFISKGSHLPKRMAPIEGRLLKSRESKKHLRLRSHDCFTLDKFSCLRETSLVVVGCFHYAQGSDSRTKWN